ncbi:MAG: PfkB family carbohydrate kinase [Thermoanaerobaculaceae bacterium]
MLAIVGGTYRERCLHPRWNKLVGSGLRAMLALDDACPGVKLVTSYSSKEEAEVRRVTTGVRGEVECSVRRQHPIEFQYDFAAASPRTLPDRGDLAKIESLELKGNSEAALVYSLIECHALPAVRAGRIVYDPQAGDRAELPPPRWASDSELAVVANRREALALMHGSRGKGSRESPKSLAAGLLKATGASVVVIKSGVFGAFLADVAGRFALIPAYKTPRVFPIGSGDVFSAVFAALWADQRLDSLDAANVASRATAYYCSLDGVTPLPRDLVSIGSKLTPVDGSALLPDGRPRMRPRRAYLAGPFFSLPQLWLVDRVASALKGFGIGVWSPHLEAGVLTPASRREEVREVVQQDLKALNRCSVVLALLHDADPGTLFEVGYAVKRGVPVVAYIGRMTDCDATMLAGSDCVVTSDLSTALYWTAWLAYHL